MANSSSQQFSNIARPYALAAFEYARDKNQLSTWKVFLESASNIVKEPVVMKLLDNPEIPSAKWTGLFQELLAPQLDVGRKNFLLLLVQNKRLMILPEISDLYHLYYAALEKISKVRVVTAIEVKEDFRQQLTHTLAKRMQREVTLSCEVDPSIIAGAIIHVGDRVIDGSIRGKLTRLLEFSLR